MGHRLGQPRTEREDNCGCGGVPLREEGSCEHEGECMALGSRREVWAGPSEPKPSPHPLPHVPSSPLALEQRLGVRFGAQMQMAAFTVNVCIPGRFSGNLFFKQLKYLQVSEVQRGVCVCARTYVCVHIVYTHSHTHISKKSFSHP